MRRRRYNPAKDWELFAPGARRLLFVHVPREDVKEILDSVKFSGAKVIVSKGAIVYKPDTTDRSSDIVYYKKKSVSRPTGYGNTHEWECGGFRGSKFDNIDAFKRWVDARMGTRPNPAASPGDTYRVVAHGKNGEVAYRGRELHDSYGAAHREAKVIAMRAGLADVHIVKNGEAIVGEIKARKNPVRTFFCFPCARRFIGTGTASQANCPDCHRVCQATRLKSRVNPRRRARRGR